MSTKLKANSQSHGATGAEAGNTERWLASIENMMDVMVRTEGPDRGAQYLTQLALELRRKGLRLPPLTQTPYVNTIPVEEQPPYPGDWQVERRIKSLIRWNAMAMVVNANKGNTGVGGHISSYASIATLYEVAFKDRKSTRLNSSH